MRTISTTNNIKQSNAETRKMVIILHFASSYDPQQQQQQEQLLANGLIVFD